MTTVKRTIAAAFLMALISASASAIEAPDPIADATTAARIDSVGYKATGWGALAFGASVVLSPLLGGGAVIVAAKVVEPNVAVPPARLAEVQGTYDSATDVMLYQGQYQETMAAPIQKARSKQAWIGTGIGVGFNLLVLMLVFASY